MKKRVLLRVCRAALVILATMAINGSYSLNSYAYSELPRSPLVDRANELLAEGKFPEAMEILRAQAQARNSAEIGFYLWAFVNAWRKQLIIEGASKIPPVDWELDWLRCGALLEAPSNNVGVLALLAESYKAPFYDEPSPRGGVVRIPGPGQSQELEKCWRSVNPISEKPVSAAHCITMEEIWRKKHSLPAHELVCPPLEPSSESIKSFPVVRIEQ